MFTVSEVNKIYLGAKQVYESCLKYVKNSVDSQKDLVVKSQSIQGEIGTLHFGE